MEIGITILKMVPGIKRKLHSYQKKLIEGYKMKAQQTAEELVKNATKEELILFTKLQSATDEEVFVHFDREKKDILKELTFSWWHRGKVEELEKMGL